MRKVYLVLLVLTVLIFTGCANKTADAIPSETNSVSPSSTESTNPDNGPTVDLTDIKVLYEYVKSDISNITEEDFETWEIYYLDITGEGTDEAVLVSTYGANWHEKIEILRADSGEVKEIPCDIYAGKYGTTVDFIDGFLTVVAASGGTGEHFSVMELHKYDGSQMVNVLNGLYVEHQVAAQNVDFIETGDIEGDLTDFIYTLTKIDNIAGKTTVVQKTQYTYNAEAMVFDEKPLQTGSVQTTQSGSGSDFSFKVSDGSLIISYGNEKRTYIEGGGVYDIEKDGFTMQEKLYVLDAYMESSRLYFSVKAPDYSVGEVLYYLDIDTGFIYWVGSDANEGEVGEGVRLTGFTDETINGSEIHYSDYAAVIIPMYPSSGLNTLGATPFLDNPEGLSLDVAVFGTLEDVYITRYDNGDVGNQWSIGDLTNTILRIHSNLQSDMSYYEISGIVDVGEGMYENVCFTIDDMRDASEYDVFLVS